MKSLTVTYKGASSAICAQTVGLWRWTTGRCVTLDRRPVGTRHVQVDKGT